jgi:hypothetical protein
MEFDNYITNEKIKKNYESQFDLVNHLIEEARNMIKSGRGSRVRTDSDNVAVNIVAEIMAEENKSEEHNFVEKELKVEIDNQVPTAEEEVELASP